jgi:hypothetical protein
MQIYQLYQDNVGTLMRLSLTTGPYYMILLFHLHTTSRVCNMIATDLAMSLGAGIVMKSRLQTARIFVGYSGQNVL